MKKENQGIDRTERSAPSCPSRPSGEGSRDLGEVIREVRKQVELESFGYRDKKFAGDLCVIIAEVYWLAERGEGSVRIEGSPLPYRLVGDIYRFLRGEHLEQVMARYRTVQYEVRNVKAYLRTALYNAVFELEGQGENEYLREEGQA